MTAPTLDDALRGLAGTPPPASIMPLTDALVWGAGGTLGSAIVAEAAAGGRFQRVRAVVRGPLASALRGLEPLPLAALGRAGATAAGRPDDTAFLVFERERHANGRDEAFAAPDPHALPEQAERLRRHGVRRLLVVLPHAPALLPHALKHGFANEAERTVAALGFEQLVFVRAAQAAAGAAGDADVPRVVRWWLSQLSWMVPPREQPLRAVQLAARVVALARRLPHAPPGTRVVPPELLWRAGQGGDGDAVFDAWLGTRAGGR